MSPAMPAKQWNQATVVIVDTARMRATAHAAPKPLSMPTTVMPAAHDDSMASSAVTPSRAAP